MLDQSRSGLAQAALQRMQTLRGGGSQRTSPWMPGGGGGVRRYPGGSATFNEGAPSGGTRQAMPWRPGGGAPQQGTFIPPKMDGMGNVMPGGAGGMDMNGDGVVNGLDKVMRNYLGHRKIISDPMHAAKAQELMIKQRKLPFSGPTGKIHAPGQVKKVAPKPTALPWDMEAANAKINANQDFQQLMNKLLEQRQGAQKEYTQGMFGINQAQPEAERGLLNNFSSRGLARSSGYGLGVGNLQNEFAGQRSAVQQRLAELLNGAASQEATGRAGLSQKMAMIQQALAQRLSGRAGKLGWGPVK